MDKPEADLAALAAFRWKLMRLVTGHLAFEDVHLYDALARGGGEAAAVAQSMAAELGHLLGSFQDHVRDWTPAAITGDWVGYRTASHALIAALVDRMDREEKQLYPLVVMAKAA